MTAVTSDTTTHAARPPFRLALAGGVTTTCSVGSLALMAAGHGVVAWALLAAGGVVAATMQLSRRALDHRRRPRLPHAAAVLLTMLAILVVACLAARAVVGEHAWLAATTALVAGAATTALLAWRLPMMTRAA